MRWTEVWVRKLGVATVVLYGIVIPLLLVNVAYAHKHYVNGTWAHSVDTSGNRDRMSIWNDNANGSNVGYAIASWDNTNTVNVRQLSNNHKKDRDVKTARYGEAGLADRNHVCYKVEWLGIYEYNGKNKPDAIFINYCMAYWDGGIWPITGDYKGPTSSDRRLRSYVHEVGHALGLHHNNNGQCTSVLVDIPSDATATCYGVQSHDVDDMRNYWPR